MKKELRKLFSRDEVAPFAVHKDWINIILLIIIFFIPSLLIAFYTKYGNIFYIVVGIIIMGGVQHTLATLVHEAAHFSLFKNRFLNEKLGHFLCAAPLLSFLKDYRYFHLEHHKHNGNLEKDPELKLYRAMGITPTIKSDREIVMAFVRDFLGIHYIRSVKYLVPYFQNKQKAGEIPKNTPFENLSVLFWFLLLPTILYQFSLLLPYVLFWIIPVFTTTPTFLRWHGYGEHIREKESCDSENTLTHEMGFIATLFLYPINSSYHLEHHLYPQVPWYSLHQFYKWANTNPEYHQASQKLRVDSLIFGKKSIVKTTFIKN